MMPIISKLTDGKPVQGSFWREDFQQHLPPRTGEGHTANLWWNKDRWQWKMWSKHHYWTLIQLCLQWLLQIYSLFIAQIPLQKFKLGHT